MIEDADVTVELPRDDLSRLALEEISLAELQQSNVRTNGDATIVSDLTDIGVPDHCAAAVEQKAHQDAAALTNPRPTAVADIPAISEDALVDER